MDPATMLPTAEFVENGMPADAISRLVEIELREPDYTKWVDLARAGWTAASLSDATAGEPDLSRRHREVRRPRAYADELRVVLASSTGTWGALTVFREKDRPYFSPAEVRLVTSLTGVISDGLRRSLLPDGACAGHHDTGMLVLDPEDGVDLANQVAGTWIDGLGIGPRAGTTLPAGDPCGRHAGACHRRARGGGECGPGPGARAHQGGPVGDRPGFAPGRGPDGTAGGPAGSGPPGGDGTTAGRRTASPRGSDGSPNASPRVCPPGRSPTGSGCRPTPSRTT
ncbi:hypothetical protein [Amycolatopsis thermalba]|nr:hypothetical protein [Amycolatopsis thermalba]